jgi:hypothetical protein
MLKRPTRKASWTALPDRQNKIIETTLRDADRLNGDYIRHKKTCWDVRNAINVRSIDKHTD